MEMGPLCTSSITLSRWRLLFLLLEVVAAIPFYFLYMYFYRSFNHFKPVFLFSFRTLPFSQGQHDSGQDPMQNQSGFYWVRSYFISAAASLAISASWGENKAAIGQEVSENRQRHTFGHLPSSCQLRWSRQFSSHSQDWSQIEMVLDNWLLPQTSGVGHHHTLKHQASKCDVQLRLVVALHL